MRRVACVSNRLRRGPTFAPRRGVRALVVVLLAIPTLAAADDTEIHLGAEVGGGHVTLLGTQHASVDAGIEVNGVRWIDPQLGIGLRLGYEGGEPWDDPHMDGHPISRQVPWLVEPRVLVRTRSAVLAGGHGHASLVAGAGAGVAWLRTVEETCPPDFDEHDAHAGCLKPIERKTALTGSLFAGGAIDVFHVALFAGVRGESNTGGDRSLGVVIDAGASF